MEAHYWVEVDGVDIGIDGVDTMSGETVILDPSLKQFTQENYQACDVDTWLPEAEDADEIALVTESDDLFDNYH